MASYNNSQNGAFKNQKIEISLDMSNKGNPLIICNNYLFGFNKTTVWKKIFEVYSTNLRRLYTYIS